MALTLKQALTLFWVQITNKFVPKESGKGLSTNDFTMEEKNKLASLENITVDTTLTAPNAAADAKAVGDALAEKQPIGDYATESYVNNATSGFITQSDMENYVNASILGGEW